MKDLTREKAKGVQGSGLFALIWNDVMLFYVFCFYNYKKYEVAKKKVPKRNIQSLKFWVTSKYISQLLKLSPPNIIINARWTLNMFRAEFFSYSNINVCLLESLTFL